MRQGLAACAILFFVSTSAIGQSALEIQGGTKSISFEHWYFRILDSVHPKLEFFNYTNALWYHSDQRPNSTLLNPYLGYQLFNGIGIAASVTFLNDHVRPFVGLQYSKYGEAFNFYSVLSYSPSGTDAIEYFLWYIYQPAQAGWKPFIQLNLLHNRGEAHNFSQLRFRFGPSRGSHAFGLAYDGDWDLKWNTISNYGVFYRLQLQ